MVNTLFLGHTIDYWLNLEASKSADVLELIRENATLRAKVSYYESRFDQI